MHLLATLPGRIEDGAAAVDLGQSPGAIVVLSAADSEIACLAAARATLGEAFPTVRLANLGRLAHPLAVDLYVERTARHARVVIARILGGAAYWRYGVERLVAIAREGGLALALLPGDDRPDPELAALSTVSAAEHGRLAAYFREGGVANAAGLLAAAARLAGHAMPAPPARPLPKAGLYWPDEAQPTLTTIRARWPQAAAPVPIVFYRALLQAGHLAPVAALVAALARRGLGALPIFVASLKDADSAALIQETLAAAPPAVILNATAFAVAAPERAAAGPFAAADCPVLQVIFAGVGEDAWAAGTRGLGQSDIAMNIALPEVDGRIITRAVSFKAPPRRDPATDADVVGYAPRADRVALVADLAGAWARLRATPKAERRIALVLANYPNRDGRIGNGVGLDTPASAIGVLQALAAAGYTVADIPADGDALIRALQAGPTNDLAALAGRTPREALPLADYARAFAALPAPACARITERWGAPAADPFVRCGRFLVPALRLGNVALLVQPARGYNIEPERSYHDPDLPPPHGYLAAYFWLRANFGAHAVIHLGKHGNLEWLPGKAVALAADCFPEVALGPLPNLYPFIVNDPGEGTQAKRRAGAVIIDHLTPPMTRAGTYGPLAALEQAIDEYYQASALDARRLRPLATRILELARATGLDRDCGIPQGATVAAALPKLDGYLCELKESQIRGGLHIFGASPEGARCDDLLVALLRLPRGRGENGDASLTRALAADLGLGAGFDPLDADLAAPWQGPRPAPLADAAPWRTAGDTVERLEALARSLVAGERPAAAAWTRTQAVLATLDRCVRPAVAASGAAEIAGLLTGLDGRFVEPGPSGAPTRGRLDVLPTGRNFYSVDARGLPTPVAWQLGWASATRLLERHAQEHGAWPRAIALSAWGTATMRTGGDDIAQALALLGVRPTWEPGSGRVGGFEVLPASVLGRPRVDVTLRVSGFFRDAFPALIDLVDSAVRAVAALAEPEADNPLAANVRRETAELAAAGHAPATAARLAGARVFGAKPGSYGAGLQALIDTGGWQTDADLAAAYVAWGGFAYTGGAEGEAAMAPFRRRLGAVDAVVHNQDNREHDLLDSDDYYQFEGGLAAAVRVASGKQPAIYHNDHARPFSPKIRTLAEEIGRVVHARAANPKWIRAMMTHGYKGAFEIAATVDYLFAFAATARVVGDHHFDALYDTYLMDGEVRAFMAAANPAALAEMAAKFLEAQERGLWRSRSNSAHAHLAALAAGKGR